MARLEYKLDAPILEYARKDFAVLNQATTAQQALDEIRTRGLGEKIIYFYVCNNDQQLVGVLPTRRLLTAPLNTPLSEMMINRVVSIPSTATVLEACELFVLYKFLAFPVTDEQKRVVGVVDVSLFTEEMFNVTEREQMEGIFEAIGLHLSRMKDGSLSRLYRLRFPWLFATIASGLLCAVMVSLYEITLTKSLVLAFFMALVLGLGESVSVQTMTVAIYGLRMEQPSLAWYLGELRKEITMALLLGLSCAVIVGLIIGIWQGSWLAAAAIGLSIIFSLFSACFLGLTIPTILHSLKLDPKIAAGPVTLGITDLVTILVYFTTASLIV